jgi:Beta-galactosidase trimerisation domain
MKIKRLLVKLVIAGLLINTGWAAQVDKPDKVTLWSDNFDKLELNQDRNSGWGIPGDPHAVSVTGKNGTMVISETGKRSYSHIQRYVPYDLRKNGFPFLQIKLGEGPGKVSVGNASTGGQTFVQGMRGPGLFSVDLRRTSGLSRKKAGRFCISMLVFGPNGRKPGPEVSIDWMKMVSGADDTIDVTLDDSQKQGEAGHGFVSVGDRIRFNLNTSEACNAVKFRIINSRTGKPLMVDGRTEFIATTDADNQGRGWSVDVPVTEKSQKKFKTWYERKGKIHTGAAKTFVDATLKGGKHSRLIGMMPYGFDLSKQAITPAAVQKLLAGKVLLETNFDTPKKDGWKPIAGENWVRKDGRFGDLSDAPGPGGLGVWAVNGQAWWDDYKFSADMAQELDGAGSVFLAVRFQNPSNYYALEWLTRGKTDDLRLIRCKDGNRYVIATSEGHKLDKFPFKLAIAVSGDYLTGYVNGKPVVTGFAGDFAKGGIALGEMGRKVLIDNAKVERIVSKSKSSSFLRNCKFSYGLKPKYFLRNTGKMSIPFIISNSSDKPFKQVNVSIAMVEYSDDHKPSLTSDQTFFKAVNKKIASLEPGATETINFELDTRLLKPSEYQFKTQVSLPREGLVRDEVITIGIARNWNPERFNYFTWNLPRDEADILDYTDHGFTMGIGGGRATPLDWKYNGKPIPLEAIAKRAGGKDKAGSFHKFDLCLKYGFLTGTNLLTSFGKIFPDEVYGLNRRGKKEFKSRLPLPSNKRFHDFSVNLAKTYALKYKDYPAYRLMDINTETENHNHPDFSAQGEAFTKKDFGATVPENAQNSYAMPYTKIPGIVKDGIIDDNHLMLRFYRWFWMRGEGYNTMALDMKKAVKKVAPQMVVFHDPAERMPFMRDRHDGINPWDWTYTAPNSLTLTCKIEILRAMAEPGNDKIVNYTQVLWKKWMAGDIALCPSATIIRLGLLNSASRPVYAVGHWNTNWMRKKQHLDRWEGVKELNDNFLKPLGPVLNNLKKDTPRKVAMLVSSTDQLFAEKFRGTWKMSTAFSAWYEAFSRASLPLDIIFEETVVEGGLKKYGALFIPFGEVISRSAYDKIRAFAKSGGKVVADSNLGYKIPGVTVLKNNLDHMAWPKWGWYQVRHGSGVKAPERIKLMWQTVDEIEKLFAAFRTQVPQADSKWLLINQREWQGVRYIYAINDHRSAGIVGKKWGIMLENGEPLTAQIKLPKSTGPVTVYDLAAHQKVATKLKDGSITWSSNYAPASAKLFALLPQTIASTKLTVPKQAERGKSFTVDVKITDATGQLVKGLIPIQVTIKDGQGAVSSYSDSFAVKDGSFKLSGIIALNDTGGTWSVTVKNLADGAITTSYFKVPLRQ